MELRIINDIPKYPPVKLIEPTTLGYIRLAAVVRPHRVRFVLMGREKAQLGARLKHLAHQLEQLDMVEEATVFHAIVMAPSGGYVKQHRDAIHFHAMTSWFWLRQRRLKPRARCRRWQRIQRLSML